MAAIGYARGGASGPPLEAQETALRAAGCGEVFSECAAVSGAAGRTELERALERARNGDVLMVTHIDRLARSVTDLHQIAKRLTAKGVGFRAIQQTALDTTTAARPVLAILANLAELESAIRRERQQEGIERAKAKGKFKGRPPSVDRDLIRRLHGESMKPPAIRDRLGISLSTVYEALKEAKSDN